MTTLADVLGPKTNPIKTISTRNMLGDIVDIKPVFSAFDCLYPGAGLKVDYNNKTIKMPWEEGYHC